MRRQALLPGQRGEQAAQGAALLGVKPSGEPVLVLAGQLGQLAHQLFACGGEVERTQPPIAGVAASLDIAAVFEFVDIGDDATGQQVQPCAQSLLAEPGLRRNDPQYARMRRGQLEHGHLFGE